MKILTDEELEDAAYKEAIGWVNEMRAMQQFIRGHIEARDMLAFDKHAFVCGDIQFFIKGMEHYLKVHND